MNEMWNPESGIWIHRVEFEIQRVESRIQGVESGIQGVESRIRRVEHGIQGVGSGIQRFGLVIFFKQKNKQLYHVQKPVLHQDPHFETCL